MINRTRSTALAPRRAGKGRFSSERQAFRLKRLLNLPNVGEFQVGWTALIGDAGGSRRGLTFCRSFCSSRSAACRPSFARPAARRRQRAQVLLALKLFWISRTGELWVGWPSRQRVLASCQTSFQKFVLARRDHRRARRPPCPGNSEQYRLQRGYEAAPERTGRVKWNVLPSPSFDSTHILPGCSSTIILAM
jgi:hypothetical protein